MTEEFRRSAAHVTSPQPAPSGPRRRRGGRSGGGIALGSVRITGAKGLPARKLAVGEVWRRTAVMATVPDVSRGQPVAQDNRRDFTAKTLAASYLKLCRDPVRDLKRWAAEDRRSKTRRSYELTTTTKGGKHVRAEASQKDTVARAVGIRAKPLHELRGRLDAPREERQLPGRLPAGPRSSSAGDGELRSVRAEGKRADLSASAFASLKSDIAAAFGVERAAIVMFYAARIEAVRRGATPASIAAAIRAIVNERLVALRNLANRRTAATREAKPPPPERPPGAKEITRERRAPG